jgi:hypothetical protein
MKTITEQMDYFARLEVQGITEYPSMLIVKGVHYCEHPTRGEDGGVIAVDFEHRLAAHTGFYDLEDLAYEDSDYIYLRDSDYGLQSRVDLESHYGVMEVIERFWGAQ